jgi:protein disulfide-isomerase
MRTLLAFALFTLVCCARAAGAPVYDENADARADIRSALVDAQAAKLPLLVVFGANWCGDCKVLEMSFTSGASAPLMHKNFRVVKVNVGKFDRNVDVAQSYGVSLDKGIPAVVLLSPQGKLLFATRGGELADARHMGDRGIYEFFARVAAHPASP